MAFEGTGGIQPSARGFVQRLLPDLCCSNGLTDKDRSEAQLPSSQGLRVHALMECSQNIIIFQVW